MADGSGPEVWQFLAILVSGVIGAAAAITAPQMLEHRKQKAESNRRRGEKCEELVLALYELDRWLDDLRDLRVFKEQLELPISPISKVVAISSIHFPQFRSAIAAMDVAYSAYMYEILAAATETDKKEIEAVRVDETASNMIIERWREFHVCQQQVIEEVSEYAKRTFV